MAGLNKYTVQEAQNAGLGQAGSVYLDTDTTEFTPTNGVVVAITMLSDAVEFDILTPEDTSLYAGIGGSGYESKGDALDHSNTFPLGVTIYGRWTSVSIDTNDMKVMCYIG